MKELKILLIQEAPGNPKLYINLLPPLGMLSIAANLEKHGFFVSFLDRNVDRRTHINTAGFDVVGFGINLANISASLNSIRAVKKVNPKIKVVVGGPSCISNPVFFTNNEYIDAVCSGEGEEAFLEYLQEGYSSSLIKGMYVRNKAGDIVCGGMREYIKNLDDIPFPALKKVNLLKYSVPMSRKTPVSSIITSRGCPHNCSFCFHSMGYTWRARSAENVADEIEWQVKELGIKEICVEDDNFLLNIERAEEIFNLIMERSIKINIQLHNGIRIENISFSLLQKMKKAGVWFIALSPETGSDKVMAYINKKVDKNKYKQVIEWCRELGISTYCCFIFGFPCETIEDLEETISLIKFIDPDVMHITRALPIKGTRLYKTLEAEQAFEDFDKEDGMLYGSQKINSGAIDAKQFSEIIKRTYREFYLNPGRILKLLKIFPLKNLLKLFSYSIYSRNI